MDLKDDELIEMLMKEKNGVVSSACFKKVQSDRSQYDKRKKQNLEVFNNEVHFAKDSENERLQKLICKLNDK